jgi:hypothetical protein
MTVPSFGPRMVCTICGAIGADARPNWNERAQLCLYGHIPSGCCARAASGQTATAPVNVKPMRCEETRSPAALSAARATVGHATVAPPRTPRKSRRLMPAPCPLRTRREQGLKPSTLQLGGEWQSGPMSALGQKQTCAVQNVMSALPPKADMPVADKYGSGRFVR